MNKILAIIRREYLSRVLSRGFLVWTILTPLLGAALTLGPSFFASKTNSKTRVVFIDQSGDSELFVRVSAQLNEGELFSGRFETRLEIPTPLASVEALKQQMSGEIKAGKLDCYVIVPPDLTAPNSTLIVHMPSLNDKGLTTRIRNAFNVVVLERRLAKEGIANTRVKELIQPLGVEIVNEGATAGEDPTKTKQAFFLALGLLVVLYAMLIFYGTFVMRGVIEEKQSRIIEVLLSSVRPFDLMLGKLVGIGLVSLTQVVIWLLASLLLSAGTVLPAFAFAADKIPVLKLSTMAFFLLYFLLGYFLYSTLYLMVGALVSAEEDAQQMQLPVIISIVIPMLMLESVLRQPNSPASVTLSLIPIFSPILMFARTIVQTPPWWQIALSVVLLVATILSAVWLAAKIYRVGVLMYGKPPTLPELWRWLKYS